MRTESTTTTSQSNKMSHESSLSSSLKYDGLLKTAFHKQIRNSIAVLFTFMDRINKPIPVLHRIVSVFRLLQLLGASFVISNYLFWTKDDITTQTIGYISIFFHIIPGQFRIGIIFYVLLGFAVLQFIFILGLFVSAFHFKTKSQIPTAVSMTLSIYISTCGYLLQPIICAFCGEGISYLIQNGAGSDLVIAIVAIVLSLFSVFTYNLFSFSIFGKSVAFRPNSLAILFATTQQYSLVFVQLISFISGLSSFLPGIYSVVLLFICAILSGLSIFALEKSGSFIEQNHETAWNSICVGSIFNYLIIAICILIKQPISFLLLIVLIVDSGIFAFLLHLYTNSRRRKFLIFLDAFSETGTCAVVKPDKMAQIAAIGMQYGHCACLDWSFFNHMVQTYPKVQVTWIIFAKFVAIYPEENRTLEWICRTIVASQFKGANAKITVEQIQSILRQRESNLSPSLKRKMAIITKLIGNCKQKQRHIWDLILQGNISEMEHATKITLLALEKLQTQFQRLMMEYPNNRFITRSYSRYLKELEANFSEAQTQIENIKLLQRGQMVNQDTTNLLGLLTFPLLPPHLTNKKDQSGTGMELEASTSMIEEKDMDNEDQAIVIEQSDSLKKQIEDLSIPVVRNTRYSLMFVFFGLIVLPSVILLAMTTSFAEQITGPLNHIYYIARIRTLLFQISQLIVQNTLQNLPMKDDPTKTLYIQPNPGTLKMSYFCGSRDVVGMLDCSQTKLIQSIQYLNYFREYADQDAWMSKASKLIFEPAIEFSFYENPTKFTTRNCSIQEIITDFITQATDMIKIGNAITPAHVGTPLLLNPSANVANSAKALDDTLDLMIKSVNNLKETTDKNYTIVEITLPIGISLAIIIWLFLINRSIISNTDEIFHAMTTIPKATISSISEQFKTLRKETDGSRSSTDNDVSRQEDYAIKLFSGFADEGSKNGGKLQLIFGTILLVFSACLVYVMVSELYKNEVSVYQRNAPHLNRLFGAYGYATGALVPMGFLFLSLEDYKDIDQDPYYLIQRALDRLDKMTSYYHGARFGSSASSDVPFVGITAGNQHASSIVTCPDNLATPTDMRSVYRCMNADTQVNFIPSMLMKVIGGYRYGLTPRRSNDNEINELNTLTLIVVYDSYFAYMFESIVQDIINEIVGVVPFYGGLAALALVIGLMGVFSIVYYTSILNKNLKYALSLLQFCPGSVIAHLPRIIEILNGKFGKGAKESTARTNEFFISLVDNMLDGIIMTLPSSQQFSISFFNKSAAGLFKVDQSQVAEIIENKKHFGEFLSSQNVSENVNTLLVNTENNGCEVDIVLKNSDGTENNLHVTRVNSPNGCIFNIRDVTQTVKHERLIAEEKLKSDKLLSSILPASLVPRVQAGEVNISFAVQSASILFLDIVEFTPWCASNTASTVMSTLNTMFSRLDMLVSTHETLTRIKCIGDCYMAAGGIFSSINQPSVHAKEMVDFGLEAIDMLDKMDQEQNLDRKIRVGINTGGPIVAGVIGVGKPTFEILGPAINMAQQMEHSGVPMKVHISRSTYEFIYGGNFIVKERGEIKIKNDSVNTYLVTGYKAQA